MLVSAIGKVHSHTKTDKKTNTFNGDKKSNSLTKNETVSNDAVKKNKKRKKTSVLNFFV